VKVQVGIERGAEAVNERDRAESGSGAGTRAVPPQALLHRAWEQAQRRTLQRGVTLEEIAQSFGTANTHWRTGNGGKT
jgi:hypothetical protein